MTITIEIEIADKDVRIDTYRSSGAGGQHVNTTDSAVRITHLPTGIVVACQGERSQHKNRATAWSMLRARLYEIELQNKQAKIDAANAQKTDIGWGHQIRSYVLQPYQLVKDLRTGVQSTNPNAVLDGDIDQFIHAALSQRLRGGGSVSGCRYRVSGDPGIDGRGQSGIGFALSQARFADKQCPESNHTKHVVPARTVSFDTIEGGFTRWNLL